MSSFRCSGFGNFADQQYFTVVLRVSKRQWNSNKAMYSCNRPAKRFGKGQPWGVLDQHYCNLPTITMGTILFIVDNPFLIQKCFCFLACTESKKGKFMNELIGNLFCSVFIFRSRFGAWFYVSMKVVFFLSALWVTDIENDVQYMKSRVRNFWKL